MGFFDKIKAGLTRTKENIANIGHSFDQLFVGELDDDFYDELEEALILSDMGVEPSMKAVEELRRRAKSEKIKDAEEGRACLRTILTEFLEVGEPSLQLDTRPSVVLFIGVNGVGKTTTIGKLAARMKGEGKRVLMAAADTFRAAAADQLEIWSERCGVDIVRQHEGADPAAVLYDALSAARARNTDVILVDTAGRLHNKQNLMNELNKMSRILERELPGADRETLLVLDATTGQNGLIQAKQFQEAAGITGIVLTKLDGSAKGGIVIAIAQELGVPVKFIGVGEGIDDLMPFEPAEFVKAFV
ncbi:MAG TPA: signal recognition particle-docking protein FtsY [Candidatus Flavonifractor merdigallinarum]|uniref:Signal recognition particle receptor FtsY n=1 Tax=Candidatus Flavonifractor merdigallinarum TaxID=2838589 RepID=A0A9D2BY32_9FIRM|nr:signal recognition particle-docking protein FtsY [Candidatus Flavonifractor merdigallinarum]